MRSLFVFANRDDNAKIINTDGETYGGSNVGNLGGLLADAVEWQGRTHSIVINLPPLAVVAFKREAVTAADTASFASVTALVFANRDDNARERPRVVINASPHT